MVKKNQYITETKKKEALKNFKLWLEKDKYPEKYVSPAAGQRESWYTRVPKNIFNTVRNFFQDLIEAIKIIIRDVM